MSILTTVELAAQPAFWIKENKMLKKVYPLLLSILCCTGCVSHNSIAPDSELAPTPIMQKQSQYSNALERLGEMMESYGQGSFAMNVPPVINETGGMGQGTLPHDVTMMVESALQNIGEPALVMAYDNNSLRVAQENNLSLYSIRGAITEFDAQVTSQRSGGQVGLYYKDADMGGEAEAELESGTIAIEFLALDPFTSIYKPGVKATAKATIQKRSDNRGFSFSILGNGFGVNGNTSVKTPVHHVLNLMIEYSMVQLVGKLHKYPYWLTIQNADPDYRMVRKLSKSFSKESQRNKVAIITYLMSVTDSSIQPSDTLTPQLEENIIRLKQHFRIAPANSKITNELYTKLITEGTVLTRKQEVMGQANEALNQVF